jgi:DNA repair photolyase
MSMSRTTANGRGPLAGRGALSNPSGRFERRKVEAVADGWYAEEEPDSIATSVEPDRARGIITTNDSPDLPFDYSINPYRGCEHGCIYCVSGDTPVLMADGTTRSMRALRVGEDIFGTVRGGGYRRYVKTRVLAHWSVVKPAFRILLEDGTELVAGADHRFLTERGWRFVTAAEQGSRRRPHLGAGNKLMGTGAFAPGPVKDLDYGRGYLCGLIRGDGSLDSYTQVRADGRIAHTNQFRLAACDSGALHRAESFLREWRIETHRSSFTAASGSPRALTAIGTQSRSHTELIRELIDWPQTASPPWSAGFLAGIFDAAGGYSDAILCISHTDEAVIGRIGESLRSFNMEYRIERREHRDRKPSNVVRVLGGLREHLRFFHSVDPAVARKRDISNQAVTSAAQVCVVAIEPLGRAMRLYDITTGSGDFIANGVVSHNCYARPSHAYLGLSAGIDFETRLFYKADAGRVLVEELARPGYVCKPISIGANTDPYQPIERRLGVTRSILEVLARTRHPMSIITKSALILRDLDLLTDLAREGLVSVAISITTLNADTKRTLEPRTASPQARLRVLRELSAAGVPVAVMVAPVIPAITDHEMEAILGAAAEVGARSAGYVLVRLPYEVKDLFREWLTEHFPERAAHVMALIRDMRGGRDNDPRFGSRMRGTGPIAELLRRRFTLACARLGLNSSRRPEQSTALFRPPVPPGAQLSFELS